MSKRGQEEIAPFSPTADKVLMIKGEMINGEIDIKAILQRKYQLPIDEYTSKESHDYAKPTPFDCLNLSKS